MAFEEQNEPIIDATAGRKASVSTSTFFKTLKLLVVSIRPKQWYKNILLFVGIVFSANLLNASMWVTAMMAFAYFCMLSAGEYLLNDILDKERDSIHPIKAKRPIASGQLNVKFAFICALSLIALALLGAYLTISVKFFAISALFMVLISLYSIVLKHLFIVDILTISSGFVIRAIAGALAIDVPFSSWLVICTFLLALFLALEKRWHEIALLSENAGAHRSNLSEYSPQMLEQWVGIIMAALIVSYLLYTFEAANRAMMFTAPFAVYGLFRYLYLVHYKGAVAEPEAVFTDKAMLVNVGVWGLIVISIILYGIWQ
jgi:4-hydroxybenzoate polyprenyltransferase